MRNLLVLAAVLLVLVAVVVVRLLGDGRPPVPAVPDDDPSLGVLTVGLAEDQLREPGAAALPASARPETEAPAAPASPDSASQEEPETGSGGQGEEQASDGRRHEEPPPGPQQPPPREEPPPPAAWAPAVTHVVGQGETLYSLVRRAYGTAPKELVEAVARANGLPDPSRLAVGQELHFPALPGYPEPGRP